MTDHTSIQGKGRDILLRQLAVDYCCPDADILKTGNQFNIHSFLDGRRQYQEDAECYLKIALIGGRILFAGREEIINWCRETYRHTDSEWFLEYGNLQKLSARLAEEGYQIRMVHPFYIADRITADAPGPDITWYSEEEIEQFRGDGRFDKAYTFDPGAPDVIGVSAGEDGRILGMAGASRDSAAMWQIGINVDPAAEGKGVGIRLVTLLKNEILRRGILPYYGTAFSHIASQRIALASGFRPAWAELITCREETACP